MVRIDVGMRISFIFFQISAFTDNQVSCLPRGKGYPYKTVDFII